MAVVFARPARGRSIGLEHQTAPPEPDRQVGAVTLEAIAHAEFDELSVRHSDLGEDEGQQTIFPILRGDLEFTASEQPPVSGPAGVPDGLPVCREQQVGEIGIDLGERART